MGKRARLILLGISLLLLVIVGWTIKGDFQFILGDFWFTSGLLLLILLSLIDQPHFSTDANIFINGVTASISLLLVQESDRDWLFWLFFGVSVYLLISSYILLLIRDKALFNENKWTQFFSRINRQIGKPDTLFSAFFLWGAIKQFGLNSNEFSALFIYWLVFTLLNLRAVANIINGIFEKVAFDSNRNAIGKIFGVQSKNTFLVKLYPDRKVVTSRFDFVEFKYSVEDKAQLRKGLVLDSYLLNEEQWIKVLTTKEIGQIFGDSYSFDGHTDDVIYKIDQVPENQYLDSFIGLVTENSVINRIRFQYNSKADVEDGNLLEINQRGRKVYYQIVEGIANIENLENKNQSSIVTGEAIQLGTWDAENLRFDSYGWVPEINTPVYLASNIPSKDLADGELQIGTIPNTNFPVVINKEIALTHHTAIVGVTGTGKSIFARNLIREHLKTDNTKAICIDFTGEYAGKFGDLQVAQIVSKEDEAKLFDAFEWQSNELEEFGNKQNKEGLKKTDEFIKKTLKDSLIKFLKSDSTISIFELPDVSNTTSILEYTRQLFKALFLIAKEERCFENKVCVVLEEAHTVIPEWNFVGISDKSSQSLLNSISQIALQGRKYDVGLMVIAQRTANVSKTVLTQCNTIIAFQEFDKTSSDFLSNYFGQGIASVLPNLKFRQAIAAGKALKSNVPMIFEVPEIDESQYEVEETEETDNSVKK